MATTVRVAPDGELVEGRARRRAHVHWAHGDVEATSALDPLLLTECDAHPFCFPPPLNAFVLPKDVVFARASGGLRASELLELVSAAEAREDADDEVLAEVHEEEAEEAAEEEEEVVEEVAEEDADDEEAEDEDEEGDGADDAVE